MVPLGKGTPIEGVITRNRSNGAKMGYMGKGHWVEMAA